MKPADINTLVSVGDPQLAPDGSQVAYVVTTIDEKANRYRSRIWLADTAGAHPPRPVSAGEETDGSPRWSPDGRALAFTSTRRKDAAGRTKGALYLLHTDGPGEASLLCEHDEAITGASWSPDGRSIAYCTRIRGEHYSSDDADRRPARRIDYRSYQFDGEGVTLDRPSHLHVVSATGGGHPRDLTPDEVSVFAPAWYPDSTRIVAVRANPAERFFGTDILRVDLDSSEVEVITDQVGTHAMPSVGPDNTIAVVGYDDASIFPHNSHVGLLDDDGQARWLTNAVDRDWNSFPGAAAPEWTDDGLIGFISDQGRVSLQHISFDGTITTLVDGDRWVTGWSSCDGTIAFSATTPERPAELFIRDPDGTERQLTNVTDAFVRLACPVTPERFTAVNDGHEIDAWIFTPPDFDPDQRYPMLFNIHGGPFAQYGDMFFDEAQHQARAGFVVVFSNPRGSSGRDNDWGLAIRGKRLGGPGWGTVDYDDLMTVVDTALDRYPFIDADRMGVIGGSYGGYMTSWIIAHTDRFAAACSERGVSNLLSLDVGSDIAGVSEYWFGHHWLDDPQSLLKMSPISYVDSMTTPLMILHSDNDLRCPHEQADQLFDALRRRDREVEYYLFPGEGHELSRSGSPAHRIQRADLIIDWFTRHLID